MLTITGYIFSIQWGKPLKTTQMTRLSHVALHPQDLAEHLVIHGHRLSATDHRELSSIFNLGPEGSRCAVDRHVALAMANLDIPPNWNVLGSHSRGGKSWTANRRGGQTPARSSSSRGKSRPGGGVKLWKRSPHTASV